MSAASFMAAEEAPASVHLQAGQVHVAAHATLVSAVLGASVAVCLWDPVARVGGMNHFLFPDGSEAMTELLEEMAGRGAGAARLVATVFGGASEEIGALNVHAALQFLEARSIPVRARQTGGTCGRQLLFHTGTGQAYVRERATMTA